MDYEGTTITVRKGQYGPYFNYQGKNYSIYKTYDANNLTAKDIEKIISYKKGAKKTNTKTKTHTSSQKKEEDNPKKEKKNNNKKVGKKKVVKKKVND